MKLKCDVLKNKLDDGKHLRPDTQAWYHDALAAHALMQAINEQCNDCAAVLQERADELMREWMGQ